MKVLIILGLVLCVLGIGLTVVTRIGVHQIERSYPPLGAFIEVDGQRLHYLDAGTQRDLPPIILLHGASSNVRDFASSILPALAQTTRVLAFDRPGLGYSDAPDRWLDPAQLNALFLAAAAQLGAQRPLLVGHSWSGSVVMAGLLDTPDAIAGGVLLGGVAGHWAGGVDGVVELAAVPVIGPLFAHTVLYPAGQARIRPAIRKIARPNEAPADYVREIGAPLALRPGQFLANAADLTKLSEFLQLQSVRYPQITAPLLMIHGAADDIVPYWNHGGRVAAVLPAAKTVLLEGVGHIPHHVASDRVVADLLDFAREVAADGVAIAAQ